MLLDGKVSYLKSSSLLDRLGVRVHAALRVLLCVECRVGLPPGDIVGHLTQKHQISVSSEDKKKLLQFARNHSVGNKPWDSPLPTNYGPPVELVKEQKGFACGIGGFLYDSDFSINGH